MSTKHFSKVEKAFYEMSGNTRLTTKIPYITVDNFPKLGFFTALRFLEWVSENPDGVISLPTGKTPEFFIKWTQHIIQNWSTKKVEEMRKKFSLDINKKPDLRGLQFVQIDEFYPIPSAQANSFYYYVNKYYLEGFGMDKSKSLLINCDTIALPGNKHFSEIFPNYEVDLSLRYKEARNSVEAIQQKAIFMIDDWCTNYELHIREKGGIGFFLGGIGPDGHIAFNTRGSDHYSTTRLTETNFETQAVAAGDLGGIEISRKRLVITIGLDTITSNPEAVAIIFAAGEAKAPMVKDALESEQSNFYPATVLQRLKNSRFYITTGAGAALKDTIDTYYKSGDWSHEKTERAIIEVCKKLNKYGHRLTVDDLKADPYCKLIPGLSENTITDVIASVEKKFERGLNQPENVTYLHTGPHHDDIMLGILPPVMSQLRNSNNKMHFSVLTSGFTAVTNQFLISALLDTKNFLDTGFIQMTKYPDFFESGYKYKWDKDVYHYLNMVASGEPHQLRRALSHRLVRALTEIYKVKNVDQLRDSINDVLSVLRNTYDGEKNPPKIQTLKGMIREFEEELVWAHFGVQVKNVHHQRLGFYTGDIFTEQPEKNRDVIPVLEMFRQINPQVISLAFDPEGSGPDTHYKVLQAIAEALREWKKETNTDNLKIIGYRNVWYKFHPAEANAIVPVSLGSMSVLLDSFQNCYLSQVDASFPSYQYDGKFSELTKKIWVNQLKDLQLLLGKDYFYQNEQPRLRRCHGLVFYKEMTVDEFLTNARELEKSTEGII